MSNHLEGWTLLPTPAGTCPQCAQIHAEDEPHDAGSLAYQYWFYNEHGRWPSWNDAIAHCSEASHAVTLGVLRDLGVDPADPTHARGAPHA